jgi:hypothetical protein
MKTHLLLPPGPNCTHAHDPASTLGPERRWEIAMRLAFRKAKAHFP